MPSRPRLYYITDRNAFAGDESQRRSRLLEKIREAACAEVDYIQLREKDLSACALESLAHEAVELLQQVRSENRELRTALLINSRTDIALACGAGGVHLRADDVRPQAAREIWQRGAGALARENSQSVPIVGVSCHSPDEVEKAAANGANFAVFAPVFEKKDSPSSKPTGLARLQQGCQHKIPVLALGGVTLANAKSCLEAGAAGIAAIRLFQENDIADIAKTMRSE